MLAALLPETWLASPNAGHGTQLDMLLKSGAAHRTEAFLLCFGPIRPHFALPRHQMKDVSHRAIRKEHRLTT
ncbi:hypothetical protein BN2475_140087 [Paraburkholderia ribeironis]|uniref:Uncharacterized protein n=1 Tax=Paraburkholderia ribeironis TaxID=1247936 RepID=A0A1N7RT13_9BURK|nr:hypothetical protein BN2475_140087 [Paraburkholderia ribeironis]